MKDLIVIEKVVVGAESVEAVDARSLHAFLKSGQEFAHWVKAKVVNNPFFAENQDYILLDKSVKQNGSGGHNKKDYALTRDTAKKVAMAEQTEKGNEARDYFLLMEKKAKALSAPPVPTTFLEAMKLSVILLEQVEQQNKQIASISEICDAAVKTKAEIGSRREATAMATASVVTRKLTKLEKILERHDCKTISELMEGTGISARVANIELETLGYLRNELVEGKKRRRLTKKGFEIAKEFPSKKFIQIGILPSCEEKVVEMILGE